MTTVQRGEAGGLRRTSPTVIAPRRRILDLRLPELWHYRELLAFLIWRDVKVRYRQSIFGATWAVIQPVMLMVVFSIFLGKLAGVPSDGVPYPLFALAGLVPWTLFSQSLTGASGSLVTSSSLLSKVYFPRLLLPVSSCGSYLLDFFIASGVLAAVALAYNVRPSASLALVPLFAVFAAFVAVTAGIWLSALNARYRDIQYAVPFLAQVWLFATPVAYPASLISDDWAWLYGLNPMAGVITGFRSALLGTPTPSAALLGASLLMTGLAFVGGLVYFQRAEQTLADVI